MTRLSVSLLFICLSGCRVDTSIGTQGDCSSEGAGCPPGFNCVLGDDGWYSCIADSQNFDASVPGRDATNQETDAALDNLDATVEQSDSTIVERDAVLPDVGDADGDGASDSTDNCVDVANQDQADADGDGLGDACDGQPDVQNFFMTIHLLTLGGSSVDDDHTLSSRITTGAGELTDGQLILKGEFNP